MTKKSIDKLGSTLNEYSGMGVSDFAKRAMMKMGWSEGKGLGTDEDGMTEAIKVKRRAEGEGLGEDKRKLEETNDDWWRYLTVLHRDWPSLLTTLTPSLPLPRDTGTGQLLIKVPMICIKTRRAKKIR